MNPLLARVLAFLFTNKGLQKLILNMLYDVSAKTDNKVDDTFVVALAKALDIRLTKNELPEDGNIFIPEKDAKALADEAGYTPKGKQGPRTK